MEKRLKKLLKQAYNEGAAYALKGSETYSFDNFLKDKEEQLRLCGVVKSLPTKKYEIDFGGNVLAGLEITNNEPIVIGAMNGLGNGISKDEITITEK